MPGSGAVGCKGAVDGGGVELRSAEGGGELVATRPFVIFVYPRRFGRGGGDVRDEGDAEAAGEANPLWVALR